MSRTVDLRRGATRIHVVVPDPDSGATGSAVLPLGTLRSVGNSFLTLPRQMSKFE